MATETYKVGTEVSLSDLLSSPLAKMNDHWDTFRKKTRMASEDLDWFDQSMKKVQAGAVVAGVGVAMLGGVGAMVQMRQEAEKLESNIGSLGVAAEDISMLSATGTKLAADLGLAKETYLTGVYDIKSAVSDLNATDLGEFAGIVGKTASATKGDFTQLSKLFGQTFHTYRAMYKDMSDLDMANLIGNTISMGVQKFRTDGAAMQQAMTSLGASGAALGIKMHEQIGVLGTLQNEMNPGEAGTAYRAFLAKVGTGMEELGLSAKDSKGNLLSMPGILEQIRKKYGESLDVVSEGPALQKAFGEEGKKLVDILLPRIGALNRDIGEMGATIDAQDWSAMEQMSATNLDNLTGTLGRLREGFRALTADAGGPLASALNTVLKPVASVVGWVAKMGTAHPGIAKVVGVTFALVAVVTTLVGVTMMAQGAWNMFQIMQYQAAIAQSANLSASTAMGTGQMILSGKTWAVIGATKAWAAVQWVLNTAMTANPIGAVIVGAVALAAAGVWLYTQWDKVLGLFDWLREKWGGLPGWVRGLVGVLLLPLTLLVLGAKLVKDHWDMLTGIPGQVAARWAAMPTWARALMTYLFPLIGIPIEIYNNWGKLIKLPGIVAGYLRKLKTTAIGELKSMGGGAFQSGAAVMDTFAQGIWSKIGGPAEAVKSALTYIGNLLPHSDAKTGPLSRLTASGHSLPNTFATGITKGAPVVTTSVQKLARQAASGLESRPAFGRGADGAGANIPGQGQGGLSMNFKNMIGELIIGDKSGGTGNVDQLGRMLAQLIHRECDKYEGMATT